MVRRLFDRIYLATEEVIKVAKKPLVEKKVRRAFEATLDSLIDEKIILQECIDKATDSLINDADSDKPGLIREIAEWSLEMDDLEALYHKIDKAQENLFMLKEAGETDNG